RDLQSADATFSRFDIVAHHTWSGQKGLDATASSAIAGRTRPFAGSRPGNRVVSPFASDSVRSRQSVSLDHHAATGAGADDDPEDDLRAGRGTVGCFRDRETVGVVGEAHGP